MLYNYQYNSICFIVKNEVVGNGIEQYKRNDFMEQYEQLYNELIEKINK